MATKEQIEALQLDPVARASALLFNDHWPDTVFTSGRRDIAHQAHAMASNIVSADAEGHITRRKDWISQTYKASPVSTSCQMWLNAHWSDQISVIEVNDGILGTLKLFSDVQLAKLTKHLGGGAFDIQPVLDSTSEARKAELRHLPNTGIFLEQEGGLVRWHWQRSYPVI